MTRDCNMFSCTQYNKFNYLYANVNRPAGSSSTPRGVDDQINPSSLSASHKESIPPPTELAHPDTIPSQFYLPDLSGREERGRVPPCNQPQMLESICQGGTVQDEGATPPPRPHPARGLAGSEGCIPPDPDSPRPSTPPPIYLGGETLQVPVSPLWPLSSATGFYQTPETSGGVPETNRPSYNYISEQHAIHACKQGTTGNNGSIDLQAGIEREQRDRDPISRPVEDVVNFLAELFDKGYQYRSTEFFFPYYLHDDSLCPVRALQAYERSTEPFMAKNSSPTLFLSWIGKHEPVSSSTTARWLRTCLQEAGIDVNTFKAHSVRRAACSSAAWSGVTVADILNAADWSTETTFQQFYHRAIQDKSSFGTTVLSSADISNIHVDMETEPSEM